MMSQDIANQSAQRSNWLREKYLELNPEMRVQNTQASQPYDQASSDLASRVGDVASKTGFSGDLSQYVGQGQQNLGMLGLNTNINTGLGDYTANANRGIENASDQWNKGMKLMGQTDARGRQLQSNNFQMDNVNKAIKRMYDKYNAEKQDPLSGAIGGLVGNFVGDKAGKYDKKKDGDFFNYMF